MTAATPQAVNLGHQRSFWAEDKGDPWKSAQTLAVATKDEVDPRIKAATFVVFGGMVVVHLGSTFYVLTSPVVKQAMAVLR